MILKTETPITDASTGAWSLARLGPLLDIAGLVRGERELDDVLDLIAQTITEGLGWHSAVVNLYRPAWDDFQVTAVRGKEHARDARRGMTSSWPEWRRLLSERFYRRGVYLVPNEAIVVPLAHSDGHLLGILSVDEPASGAEPTDEEIDLLYAVAAHAARAVEHVQKHLESARHRAALEHLHEVSARLSAASSPEAALQAVAGGVAEALGFQKVCVLVREGDGFVPAATAGWSDTDPAVDIRLSVADLERLFEPSFELEGCYVLPREAALARCSSGSPYASVQNGRGPWAWARHWLLAPLRNERGKTIGVIWADDPDDRLLPSQEKLRVLRMFANHASTALELQRMWAAEHTSNELLRATIGGSPLATIHLDCDGVVRLWNAAAEELYGWRAEEIVGKPFPLASPEQRLEFTHLLQSVLAGDSFSGVEVVRETRTGDKIDVSVSGAPLYDAGGNVIGGIAVHEDIRRRKHAEKETARRTRELEALQELYGRLLETSTDAMMLFDLDGTITFASRATETICGWAPQELIGRNFVEIIHPDDIAAANESIQEAIATGNSRSAVARIQHKAGHHVLVEGKPAVIRNSRGEPEMILGIARDITDRMEAEKRRRELEAQLRQSQRLESIGSLAGGIAHDFNNLLTAIGGYGALALEAVPEDAPELQRDIQEMLSATERARQLIRQLLAFSRRQVLQPTVLDLNEVVTDMNSMLQRLIGENVDLITALDPELGYTNADRGQIEQVLMNLCINARDAITGGGKLVVDTFNADLDDEFVATHVAAQRGAYVAVRVTDDGHGMTKEVRARVFEPFFTTKEPTKGTGLGLSTVYGIVKQSGGYIWCDTTPGSGTTFTVYLPRFESAREPSTAEPAAAASPRGAETVLLVEDEHVVRALVHQTLERLGYSVIVAANGAEALDLLEKREGAVDLLLTDLVMPAMNGRELAAIVKERSPRTRILFMTGYAEDAVASHGVLQPGAPLLEKPFTANGLGEQVRAVLDA